MVIWNKIMLYYLHYFKINPHDWKQHHGEGYAKNLVEKMLQFTKNRISLFRLDQPELFPVSFCKTDDFGHYFK